MTKINNLDNILINGNCLIEVETVDFNTESTSGLVLDPAYNKGTHARRFGILAHMFDSIDWQDQKWITNDFPDDGDEVFFDYLDAKDSPEIECDGKNYIILPFTSLIMARNSSGDVKLLNGYLLAQKAPIAQNELDIEQRYYDDIYVIKYAGEPNISYRADGDIMGKNVRRNVDDKSITANDTIMTKQSAYPVLEESMHWRFSEETYYTFQRKDCVARVGL